ncbi:hypothetical protein K4105_04395, partial [Buchnera aphidicola]|nr:hypothetical protein [Buchnera aphidicola]
IKLLNTWHGNFFSLGEKSDIYISQKIKELNKKNTKKICKTAEKWLLPILKNKKEKCIIKKQN